MYGALREFQTSRCRPSLPRLESASTCAGRTTATCQAVPGKRKSNPLAQRTGLSASRGLTPPATEHPAGDAFSIPWFSRHPRAGELSRALREAARPASQHLPTGVLDTRSFGVRGIRI